MFMSEQYVKGGETDKEAERKRTTESDSNTLSGCRKEKTLIKTQYMVQPAVENLTSVKKGFSRTKPTAAGQADIKDWHHTPGH